MQPELQDRTGVPGPSPKPAFPGDICLQLQSNPSPIDSSGPHLQALSPDPVSRILYVRASTRRRPRCPPTRRTLSKLAPASTYHAEHTPHGIWLPSPPHPAARATSSAVHAPPITSQYTPEHEPPAFPQLCPATDDSGLGTRPARPLRTANVINGFLHSGTGLDSDAFTSLRASPGSPHSGAVLPSGWRSLYALPDLDSDWSLSSHR
ncbi:hypothetical protein C8Q80DRAFT_1271140 [Daedaleopsis nitida]|nr:hypothetical protein C8Q80DRAFT_1271140 [Daedaleopsis nitida]